MVTLRLNLDDILLATQEDQVKLRFNGKEYFTATPNWENDTLELCGCDDGDDEDWNEVIVPIADWDKIGILWWSERLGEDLVIGTVAEANS